MTRSFWSEPFLWIHLSGIAVVPISLQLVWIGLAIGNPLPFFWLELFIVVLVGIVPILWMQLYRPFDIFSILILALKPNVLTEDQLRILSLFKTKKHQVLTVIAAILMLLILWEIYLYAPLASSVASLLPQIRVLGLLIASGAFLVSNLFLQIPLSVLSVMFTSDEKFSNLEPYPTEKITQSFTIPGLKVGKILPNFSNNP